MAVAWMCKSEDADWVVFLFEAVAEEALVAGERLSVEELSS